MSNGKNVRRVAFEGVFTIDVAAHLEQWGETRDGRTPYEVALDRAETLLTDMMEDLTQTYGAWVKFAVDAPTELDADPPEGVDPATCVHRPGDDQGTDICVYCRQQITWTGPADQDYELADWPEEGK